MSPGSTRKLPPAGWRRTALTACLLRSLSKAASAVLDNGDGTYGVSYTPQEVGAYSVWVCVRAQHVQVRRLKTFSILRKVAPRRRALTPPPRHVSVHVPQGSPFALTVSRKWRHHSGTFHCCCFCSSGGSKEARCGCPGTMPGTAGRSVLIRHPLISLGPSLRGLPRLRPRA